MVLPGLSVERAHSENLQVSVWKSSACRQPAIDTDTGETVEVASVRTDMSLVPYRLTIGLKQRLVAKFTPTFTTRCAGCARSMHHFADGVTTLDGRCSIGDR
jgi:hypothetical protein